MNTHRKASLSRSFLPIAAVFALHSAASSVSAQDVPAARWFRELPDAMQMRPGQKCLRGVAPTASDGGVSVALEFSYADHEVYNPSTDAMDKLHLRSYNGCPTGPLIRIKPGNTLRVQLNNTLPVSEPTFECPPDGMQAHRPHCFNTTNLHTHGLHVSPTGNSDNMFVSVGPGQSFQYEFKIPPKHPAGTFWYHPHHHGSTAIQVASGAAGVLLVPGQRRVQDKARNEGISDIDTLFVAPLTRRPFKEQTLLMQQTEYGCFNSPTAVQPQFDPTTLEWTCAPGQAGELRSYDWQLRFINQQLYDPSLPRMVKSTWDFSGRYTQINGAVQPVLPALGERIAAGEVQRWRLLHGGVRDSINFKIVKARFMASADNEPSEASVDRTLAGAMSRLRAARSKRSQETELAGLCSGEPVNQIEFALDGTTRAAMVEKALNPMHPGQRSDVLVSFPTPGLYCVLDEAADGASTINFRPENGARTKNRRLLSLVRVGLGWGVPAVAPDGLGHTKYWQHVRNRLVAANLDLPKPVLQDLVALKTPEYAPYADLVCPPQGCPQRLDDFTIANVAGVTTFGINGRAYTDDPNDPNFYRPVLGRTDEWAVRGNGAHIFHPHVNAVQIVDVLKETRVDGVVTALTSIFDKAAGRCKPEFAVPDPVAAPGEDATQYCDQLGAFRDTVFQKGGYRIVTRTRFDDFTGKFVMHCHILDHEDEGMMMNVQVESPAVAALGRVLWPMRAGLVSASSRTLAQLGWAKKAAFVPSLADMCTAANTGRATQ